MAATTPCGGSLSATPTEARISLAAWMNWRIEWEAVARRLRLASGMATIRSLPVKRVQTCGMISLVPDELVFLEVALQSPRRLDQSAKVKDRVLARHVRFHEVVGTVARSAPSGGSWPPGEGMLTAEPDVASAPVTPPAGVALGAVQLDGSPLDHKRLDVLRATAVVVRVARRVLDRLGRHG